MEELLKELEEAKAKIVEIEKKIEEKKSKRWKPKVMERYYYINIEGKVIETSRLNNGEFEESMYNLGNCFRTKEEAEFITEKLKVITKLKEFAEPEDAVWDGNEPHYYIGWNCLTCEISIYSSFTIKQNEIYFASKDDWTKAIKAVGKDRIRKYYLGM